MNASLSAKDLEASMRGIVERRHTAVEFHLPFPVSVNAIWKTGRGNVFKSKRYKAWLTEAGWTAKQQRVGSIEGPFKISIQAVRPDKRKRDLDNILKSTFDLLQSIGVIQDDCECEMLTARWVTGGEGISVRVEKAGLE